MNLLTESLEPFNIMDKSSHPDGYGGVIYMWTEGAEINGAIADMSEDEVVRAQQRGSRASYTFITDKSITLMYGDILKRANGSEYFKVTTDGKDKQTPNSPSLKMRVVDVEKLTALP